MKESTLILEQKRLIYSFWGSGFVGGWRLVVMGEKKIKDEGALGEGHMWVALFALSFFHLNLEYTGKLPYS